MKKLRLLLFKQCNRKCKGCCNKDWDVDNLKVCKNYSRYKIIMLTGGEPMLHPNIVHSTIRDIRKTSKAQIYIYTAKVNNFIEASAICMASDGLCVTLHSQKDVIPFFLFCEKLGYVNRSLRVNIFKGVKIKISLIPKHWVVKKDIEWIKDCPLPKNESFMRIKDSF